MLMGGRGVGVQGLGMWAVAVRAHNVLSMFSI